MEVNIQELEVWLDQHKDSIPERSKWKRTLMDIAGITKLENQWSYIYLFFLNPKEAHHFGDLFIRSLEQVIGCDQGWLQNFKVEREVQTKVEHENQTNISNSKGRIDLLLTDFDQKRAILIENKVFHVLDGNDLIGYKKYVETHYAVNVTGIVLSLHNLTEKRYLKKIKNSDYINVTHEEFIKTVDENIDKYTIDKQSIYYKLYQDFKQNIINVSNEMKPERFNFFIMNYSYIQEISFINKEITSIYKDCFKELSIKDYSVKNGVGENDLYLQLQYDKNPSILLTIFYDRIWKNYSDTKQSTSFTIALELQKDVMKSFMRNDFLQKAKKKYENSNLCFEGAKDKDGKLWWHFALVDVELSVDDVKPEEFKRFLENYLDQTPPICKLCAEIIDYSNKTSNDTAKI